MFDRHLEAVGIEHRSKGLTSDEVRNHLGSDLQVLGFDVEAGMRADQHKMRPVFFGENSKPSLQYEIDAWHPGWAPDLEIEAGRAWMGNEVYRDRIQALVMVELNYLFLAVPLGYRYKSGGRNTVSRDYANAVWVCDALYGHSRITMHYSLCVIGY